VLLAVLCGSVFVWLTQVLEELTLPEGLIMEGAAERRRRAEPRSSLLLNAADRKESS
jgi:hypothetical protein